MLVSSIRLTNSPNFLRCSPFSKIAAVFDNIISIYEIPIAGSATVLDSQIVLENGIIEFKFLMMIFY